ERPHAVDRRDGGGGQHGDGLRHRRHDGSGDRLCDRRGGGRYQFGAGGAGPISTSALSEGAHPLTLKATDAAGNQSAASTPFHVTIDTVGPSAPVIDSVTDEGERVTGGVAENGSSNDPTLTIGGTAEAGSTVTIYDTDGTTVLGTGVATGGAFTI